MEQNLNVSDTFASIHPAIVIDNGSCMMKAGYAGEDFPRAITPNIVGTTRSEGSDIPFQHGPFDTTVPANQEILTYAGRLAKINENVLDIVYPMNNGLITDWDAMEKLWCYIFYEELVTPPENFNILHTESLLNSMSCREKLVEIMFEKFNVPNTTSVPKSVLPLYSHGKVTGLVVDSGYEYTHVVPIEGGYPVAHGVRNMPIGGWHVTQYMKQLINERGYDWKTSKDIDVVTIIKEKFGYCSLDVEKDQAMFTEDMEQNYTLPDGMIFKVKSEKFRGPEIMFNPALFNIESHYGGIHDLIYKSCSDCRIEEQPNLYGNIVLAGGNTLFPHLSHRLKNMLPNAPVEVVITANPERKYSTWVGGSILASLSTFDQVWISSEDYKENGPRIVYSKNYYNL